MIPWEEWRESILGEKKEETEEAFEKGDGIKKAEKILKRMRKKGSIRAATPEEIKKIKERNAKRRKNK